MLFDQGRTGAQRLQDDHERQVRGHVNAEFLFRGVPAAPAVEATKAPATRPAVQSIAQTPATGVEAVQAATANLQAAVAKAIETVGAALAVKAAPAAPAAPTKVEPAPSPRADRVLVSKGGALIKTFRALEAKLSDHALTALNTILAAWEAAGRRPVKLAAADIATSSGLSPKAAQAAWAELTAARAIIAHHDSNGALHVRPGLGLASAQAA